jgi:hypothetical protein
MDNYGFDISLNTAVFTTSFVIYERKPITCVYHHSEDGAWEFLSADEFDDIEKIAKIVALEEIIDIDSSIIELSQMQEGFFASRRASIDIWEIKKINDNAL